MLASRSMKPKLSLSISTAAAQSSRPALSLKSPMSVRSPISPSPTPVTPTARNTQLNQRGYSTMQQPTYAYVNSSSSRSILKKSRAPGSSAERKLQFCDEPVIHRVAAIEEDDYYGSYAKMTREERRWTQRR